MKLGVSACLWVADFTDRDLGLIPKAREFGFEAFDIPVFSTGAFDVNATRAACERAGIEPILATPAGPERDLVDSNPAVRARGQQHLRHCIDLIVALGGNLVSGPFCSAPLRFWISDERQKQ